jgi:signal transduction histidine kinase
MNPNLQTILDFIEKTESLSSEEKKNLAKFLKDADHDLTVSDFKLGKTEKVKKTTAILLEETIQELEEKRRAVEAQNRELEIEASLETVRSRSLAMHKSDELQEVVNTVFVRLTELGIENDTTTILISKEGTNDLEGWIQNTEHTYSSSIIMPFFKQSEISRDLADEGENAKQLLSKTYSKVEKDKWFNHLFSNSELRNIPDDRKMFVLQAKSYSVSQVHMKYSGIVLSRYSDKLYSDPENDILIRFAKVFEQAYTRFLDLQKAEAQAKEAQIEAALERVRSKTMAMHNSQDVGNTVAAMFDELVKMEFLAFRFGIVIFHETTNLDAWTVKVNPDGEATLIIGKLDINIHPMLQGVYKAWKNKEPFFTYELASRDLKEYYLAINNSPDYPVRFDMHTLPEKQIHTDFFFADGALFAFTTDPIPSEKSNVLKRFAGVFGQTYRRYLDLQKAEAQEREAKIEAALERVRSRTMAMQKSNELREVIQVIHDQFLQLNIPIYGAGFAMDYMENDDFNFWLADTFSAFPSFVHVPYFDHPQFNRYKQAKENGLNFYTSQLTFEEKNTFFDHLSKYVHIPDNLKEAVYALPGYGSSHVVLKNVMLYILNFTGQPFSNEENAVLSRFGNVFEQVYIRFNDLKQAEAQEREARIEAALERVRSKTMAMHNSQDVGDTVVTLFGELVKLGVRTNRCGILINGDPLVEVWVAVSNPDGKAKLIIGKLDISIHPLLQRVYSAWKNKEEIFTYEMAGDDLKAYYQALNDSEFFPGLFNLETLPEREFHSDFFFPEGSLFAFTKKPILPEEAQIFKRFAGVFSQTYRRYIDLQKAEAQARESQIQLAMERVRARTMAMQRSEELADAALILFQQVNELGVHPWTSGFQLWDEDRKSVTVWTSTEGVLLPPFKIPATEDPLMLHIVDAMQKGEVLYVEEMSGEVLEKHYRYMFSLPALQDVFGKIAAEGHATPTFQVNHAAYFSNGYLLFITHESCPEMHEIFIRFAKVFEQTYTRFLDLQKSEIQAREAQIELALERVRARTMAMQKSSELQEVANTVYERLQELEIDMDFANLVSFIEGSKDYYVWMSNFSEPLRIPFNDFTEVQREYNGAMERRDELFTHTYSGDKRNEYYRFLFDQTDLGKFLSGEQKKKMLDSEFNTSSIACTKNTAIQLLRFSSQSFSKEENEILKRFAKVFEQAYIRFLDLQKAEAQAREAQIEAALERVRSRSMGMHKSEELRDVIQVVYEQFVRLGLNIFTAGFYMDIQESNDWNLWVADAGGAAYPTRTHIPYLDHPIFHRYVEAKEKGLDVYAYSVTYHSEEKNKILTHWIEHNPQNNSDELLEWVYSQPGWNVSNVILKNVGLYIYNWELTPFSDSDNSILLRFAKVFEQTYTRFLDLQKAEAQAREAQIEAALERVRSRTMAMQKSEELAEVIQVIYDQLVHLGINMAGTGFRIDYRESNDFNVWYADASHTFPTKLHIPYFDHPLFNRYIEAKETGLDFYAVRLSYEEKNKFFQYFFELNPDLSDETKKLAYSSPGLAESYAMMKNVVLFIQNLNDTPFSDEENATLMRFGKAFEQTYTRFNDLKQAEAQAREAKIEASLERVRSRTMAMQKSEELRDVIQVIYEQLIHLKFEIDNMGFLMDYRQSDDYNIWAADTNGVFPTQLHIPYFDHPINRDYINQRDKGVEFFAKTYSFEEKNKWWEMNSKSIIGLPAELKDLLLDVRLSSPGLALSRVFMKNIGLYLLNFSGTPYSEEDNSILKRFANAFEQTFTRFLDLQKAEEQAMEAKIETALERVRSRTMGMQKSEELLAVIQVVYEQLILLNFEISNAGFLMDYRQSDDYNIWSADASGVLPNKLHIPYFDHVFNRDYLEHRDNGPELFAKTYSFEEKNKWWETMFKSITGLPAEIKDFLLDVRLSSPGLAVSRVFMKNIGLYLFNFAATPYSDLENATLIRFCKVFEQTYTRFNDLKQAEAQAREARIESALEKVRSRTMAMQKSDELSETASLLFDQFSQLGESPERAFIGIVNEEEQVIEIWATQHGGTKMNMLVKATVEEPVVMQRMYQAWKEQKKSIVIDLRDKELEDYFQFLKSVNAPVNREIFGDRRLENIAFFSKGMMGVITREPRPQEAIHLYERFAGVFDLTYTRFLDLKKAEAQAKEARIELGLERVRARAMAMHSSSELSETSEVLFHQLKELGIQAIRTGVGIFSEDKESVELWLTSVSDEQTGIRVLGNIHHSLSPIFESWFSAWKRNDQYFSARLQGDEIPAYYKTIAPHLSVPQQTVYNPEEFINGFFFPEGTLNVISTKSLSDEECNIVLRFARVFGLIYRRFLDLQRAERQARESQIEAGLERVRSRAMAMQSSDDVGAATSVMFSELDRLSIETMRCGILIIHEDQTMEVWTSGTGRDGQVTKVAGTLDMTIHPLLQGIYRAWEEKEEHFIYKLEGSDMEEYYKVVSESPNYSMPTNMTHLPRHYSNIYLFEEGGIFTFTVQPHTEETKQVIKKFTAVFSLTFRRYQDLKNAEFQARESKIEAALERVRAKAMAMQNSKDLESTASIVFSELHKLGINPLRSGVGLLTRDSKNALLYAATATPGNDSLNLVGVIDMTLHPSLQMQYNAWLKMEDYFLVLGGNELKSYYEVLSARTSISSLPADQLVQEEYGYYFAFSEGTFYSWSHHPYSENEIKILVRFKSIIDLTFRRYIELQKLEANARDARKQASLDRVRGEIASMRSAEDLQRITPLIWHELTSLGVPFFRCGVFIVDESIDKVQAYLSTPEGHSLGVLNLAFDANEVTQNVVGYWRKQQVYREHWNQEQFIQWMQSIIAQGQIKETKDYQGSVTPPESLDLHFINFKQGMMYVGNTHPLEQQEVDLVKTLADTFAIAYSRYEDFKQLEDAKNHVESTLNKLKSTQSQLIQSEKMASLGELTAGIAHEIQNPLNFVNNFSEVNKELLLEMIGEIDKGNLEEVKALAKDVIDNQEKINHHGKRADGIVKGMLQHSRSSTGIKEPTNVNVLADEYLRLAYHGLRAKDKSFNASMDTDFDERIGTINIIPQDMGRVILNLITNAFFAVTEKKKLLNVESQAGKPFEPRVTVKTKKAAGNVEIRVIDNGTGIPQKNLYKIFQPFFTTKLTGQGTGLGLSLSYDIVKAHGGELKVATKEGEGSEFIIQLPIV